MDPYGFANWAPDPRVEQARQAWLNDPASIAEYERVTRERAEQAEQAEERARRSRLAADAAEAALRADRTKAGAPS